MSDIVKQPISDYTAVTRQTASHYATDEELKAVLDARWSGNTKRSYLSQWKQFVSWCEEYSCSYLPATPENVARYVVSRHLAGAMISTLRTGLAAISAVHKDLQLDNPAQSPIVKAAVQGCNRIDTRMQRQVNGIDEAVLNELIRGLYQPYVHKRNARQRKRKKRNRKTRIELTEVELNRARETEAILRLLQSCGLRRSELTALAWSDVSEQADDSGLLLIRHSKTDQTSQGAELYINRATMRALKAIRPINATGSIFMCSDATIAMRIKAACKRAGINPSNFSGHSGRVGFAQMLTFREAPTSEVMRMGRWRSPVMVARYTRGLEAKASAKWLEG